MIIINNLPHNFFKEIRKIEVYDASGFHFNSNFKYEIPQQSPIALFKNIISEDFNFSLKRKSRDNSYYYNIDISFGYYGKDTDFIEVFNKKDYVIKVFTNTDYIVLGNDREPLSIEILDETKNDNSGGDKIQIEIFGETIILPKAVKL